MYVYTVCDMLLALGPSNSDITMFSHTGWLPSLDTNTHHDMK